MALRWNLEAIQNADEVCWITTPVALPDYGVEAGEVVMNPITTALIWACMAVDLPGITRENAAEFFARLRFTESLEGPRLIRAEVDGVRPEGAKAFITAAEVWMHVGLTANVTAQSRSQWLRRWNHDLDEFVRSFQRKQERAQQAVEAIRFENN